MSVRNDNNRMEHQPNTQPTWNDNHTSRCSITSSPSCTTNMSTDKLANRTSDTSHTTELRRGANRLSIDKVDHPILHYTLSDWERSRHTSKGGVGGNFNFTCKIATIRDREAKRRIANNRTKQNELHNLGKDLLTSKGGTDGHTNGNY